MSRALYLVTVLLAGLAPGVALAGLCEDIHQVFIATADKKVTDAPNAQSRDVALQELDKSVQAYNACLKSAAAGDDKNSGSQLCAEPKQVNGAALLVCILKPPR